MLNFGKLLKRYLGPDFSKLETEKINKARAREGKNKKPISIINYFRLLLRTYPSFGHALSGTQIKLLQENGLLKKPGDIPVDNPADINMAGFIEIEEMGEGQEGQLAGTTINHQEFMQNRNAFHLQNSLASWLLYFEKVCKPLDKSKDKGDKETLNIYYIILRNILKRESNWGKREKDTFAEYPCFHPKYIEKVMGMLVEIIKLYDGNKIEQIKKEYGNKAFHFIQSANLSGLMKYLTEVLFYKDIENKFANMHTGEYTWLTLPEAGNLAQVQMVDAPNLGILSWDVENYCIAGASVGFYEYLKFGKVMMFGKIEEMTGLQNEPIKKFVPKIFCFIYKGEVHEFRGASNFQELDSKTLGELEKYNNLHNFDPTISKFLENNRQEIENSLKFNHILNKIEEIISKKRKKDLDNVADLAFLQAIDENTKTVGSRSPLYLKRKITEARLNFHRENGQTSYSLKDLDNRDRQILAISS